jgi:hypothetical protein
VNKKSIATLLANEKNWLQREKTSVPTPLAAERLTCNPVCN